MRAIVMGLALCLAGCGGGSGGSVMTDIMKSWEGQPLDAVITQWGYPHEEKIIAGRKLYVWNHNKSIQMPATTSGTITSYGSTAYIDATTTGGGSVRGTCTRTIEVDANNRVARWQYEGNNCPVMDLPGFEYGTWRRRS
jgi:hypothetical protein